MGQQSNDSDLTGDETRYDGELPTLELALTRTGLFAGSICRIVIEKELDRLQAENKRLKQENGLLRRQTGEYIKGVLAGFASTAPDQDG